VTVVEGNDRRVCGQATPDTRQLYDEAVRKLVPGSTSPTRSTRELLAVRPPEGYHQIEDQLAAVPPDARPGRLDGWTKAWKPDGYGGARATATRYDSPMNAVNAVRYALEHEAGDAIEVVTVPDVPNAVGFRMLAFAWLGVQTPDVGPYLDVAYAVFGGTVSTVAFANLATGTDHRLVSSLIAEIRAVVANA
jgi:hypothetical protein